jgi:hypothetical protein
MSTPPIQRRDDQGEPTSPTDIYNEKEFKGLLSDEYKMLQDKIDRIGAFRFTIKGWALTAVIGASAAAGGRSLPTVCTIWLGLLLMLFFFFLLEHEQVRWSRLFGDRAGRLEDAFRRVRRGRGQQVFETFSVPYTAHELVLEVYRHQEHKGGAKSRSVKARWKGKWHSWRRAHVEFYLALGVLTFVPLFPHYHSIVIVLKGLIVRLTCWIAAHF